MTDKELLKEMFGIVEVLADEIYFHKCLYFNVPQLSEPDKRACVDEAVKALPKFLETYARYSATLKDISTKGARHEQGLRQEDGACARD